MAEPAAVIADKSDVVPDDIDSNFSLEESPSGWGKRTAEMSFFPIRNMYYKIVWGINTFEDWHVVPLITSGLKF